MVNWYHRRGQIVHALSLAREWIVSRLCWHFGLDVEDSTARSEMEFLLGGGKKRDESTDEVRVSPYLADLHNLPLGRRLQSLWAGTFQLAKLRNDVLHSGFRKDPKPSADLKQAVDKALFELNEIAAALSVSPQSPLQNLKSGTAS
jgi:hypothetical protein